uniref:Arrestin C-terminal-like domain-containing protein n=1 Tax=Megaselia scalaris TaxID=36166 RepID=T1GIN9_MEGSC
MLCDIEFINNPQKLYYTGGKVNVRVTLKLEVEKTIEELLAKVIGLAKVDFRRTSDKTHFMNQKNFLVVNQTLPPGTHVYEFEVEIPAECPSSFIGKYGKILYKVDVIASRLMNLNRKFSAEFHVIRPLTNFSVSNLPQKDEYFTYFCCWPCERKILLVEAMIPKSAFATGDCIPIFIKIDNCLENERRQINIRLMQLISYRGHRLDHETEKNVIQNITHVTSNYEVHEKMDIPHHIATSSDSCDILKISYSVNIFMDRIKFKFPVTIGGV